MTSIVTCFDRFDVLKVLNKRTFRMEKDYSDIIISIAVCNLYVSINHHYNIYNDIEDYLRTAGNEIVDGDICNEEYTGVAKELYDIINNKVAVDCIEDILEILNDNYCTKRKITWKYIV